MRKLILGLLLGFTALQIKAQKNDSKIAFNIGAELAKATGNLNEAYSIGLGITAQLEYTLDDKKTITLNSGIMQYVGRKVSSILPNTPAVKIRNSAVIPVLAGIKYSFASNFYGAAQLGVSIFSGSQALGTKLTYSPGLGFKANDKYDILLKYTGYANAGGAFGVRVSYAL